MEHYQSNKHLSIKNIIQSGTRSPEDYTILFYKEVFDRDVSVKIRGLSNYEFDEISIKMYDDVKDLDTIEYLFNPKKHNEVKEAVESDIKESTDILDVDIEKKNNVNMPQLINAYSVKNVLVVFYAMKDFYPNLTLSQVKQLEGIDQIAERINEKSGRTPEIMEKIEFFREKYRKLGDKVSTEKGTYTLSED